MRERIGTKEAAEMTGLTRARISQLCKAGILTADFISNVWLIDKNSVRIYVQEKRKKKAAQKNLK